MRMRLYDALSSVLFDPLDPGGDDVSATGLGKPNILIRTQFGMCVHSSGQSFMAVTVLVWQVAGELPAARCDDGSFLAGSALIGRTAGTAS